MRAQRSTPQSSNHCKASNNANASATLLVTARLPYQIARAALNSPLGPQTRKPPVPRAEAAPPSKVTK